MKKVFLFFFITLFIATGVFAENNAYQPYWYLHDGDGDPCVGCYLYTYEAGTTTPKAVYTDEDCSVAAANPVVLDSRGEAAIYICDEYKFVLKDADGVTIRTIDDVGDPATSSSSTTYAYYPDASETDQGATASGSGDTIYDIAATVGTSKYAKIVLRHDGSSNYTTYTFDTSLDLSSYTKLYIEVQPGARIAQNTGDEVLTLASPENLIAPENLQITAYDMFDFDTPGVVYPEWWGAIKDDGSSDTTATTRALTSICDCAGGVLQFGAGEYDLNLDIPAGCSGVTIRGITPVQGYETSLDTGEATTQLTAAATGYIIDTPATILRDITIENIYFHGLGSGTALVGIYFDYVRHSNIRYCGFGNIADQAIKTDTPSAALIIEGNTADECLLASQSSRIGVFDLTGSDFFISHNEVSGGLSALSSGDFYYCAFKIGVASTGGNHFIHNNVGENADVGFYFYSAQNRIVGNRADINYAHGFYFSGSGFNTVQANHAYRCGLGTDDTYSGFYFEALSSSNLVLGNLGYNAAGDTNKQKYGFYDASQFSDQYAVNIFVANKSYEHQTAPYGYAGNQSSSFEAASNVFYATDEDATPDVSQANCLRLNYTTNTEITDFDNGSPGQLLQVIQTDGAGTVTIDADGGAIVTNTGSDKNLTQEKVYTFRHVDGVWYEVE